MKRSLLVAILLTSFLVACSDKQADVESAGSMSPATEEPAGNEAATDSTEVTTENEAAAPEEVAPAVEPAAE